ncbi:MAG TPA: DUF6067 family protein [Phycisphaerae bacterium]|nr:DUF6067 family protein [Phycisphaerae bacterium]
MGMPGLADRRPVAVSFAAFILIGVLGSSPAWAAESGSAADIPYGVGKWDEPLGNHRARLVVDAAAPALRASIEWRRCDPDVEKKDVLVVDARNGKPVANRVVAAINRERGEVVFQASTAGEYYVYYMPCNPGRSAFPTARYNPPKETAAADWLAANRLRQGDLPAGEWKKLPQAKVLAFQARTDFDSVYPMEVIATAQEIRDLLARHGGKAFLLFPEDRRFPIRMTDDLPLRWMRTGPAGRFAGKAQPGEYYVFQVGLYAVKGPAKRVAIRPGDVVDAGGKVVVPAGGITCFNLAGRDWLGRPMQMDLTVPEGKVQAMWLGMQIPPDASAGLHRGEVTVSAEGAPPAKVSLEIEVAGEQLPDCGDGELWRLSRLRWLNSDLGVDDELVPPFTAVTVNGDEVGVLGRRIRFGETGLPASIVSTFAATPDRADAPSREILNGPVAFVAQTPAGAAQWKSQPAKLLRQAPGAVYRQSDSQAGPLRLSCWSKTECDGYTNFRIKLTADTAVTLTDARLEIPFHRDVARYLMGMGRKGGLRPEKLNWKWDRNKHQDAVWIGDVNAGLQVKLKGPAYTWPNVNIHYRARPLDMPDAWVNGGKGGCDVIENGDSVLLRVYAGPRELQAGQTLEFHLGLLVTPVKSIRPAEHWAARYYHTGGDSSVDAAAAAGATVINLHQGGRLNPYINYPFLTLDSLKKWIDAAHAKGMRAKIYYTLRELSNHVVELPALRSLGNEIYSDGPGGGSAWLMEHLRTHYKSAWHEWLPNGYIDASIATAGLSRWHNYYVESLGWLARTIGLDGLYLDDIGYDREIMKRVRKVLLRANPRSMIDVHSWNHYNGRACFANSANLFMEHMPYVDRLWLGEGFNYNGEPSDYWMVEISSLPFGLMGEMLQGGGNPWRGMVYGMTNRLGWGGNPKALWKLWDEFGLGESRMIGYWDPACPVRTGRPDVLATAYVRKGRTLISIASWAPQPVQVKLDIDFKALGLDPAKAHLYAPVVNGFQGESLFQPGQAVPLAPGKGWLLWVDEQARSQPPAIDPFADQKVILEDRFAGTKLDEAWSVSLSAKASAKLAQEKGAMVISAGANSYAYAERPLPPGVRAVTCRVNQASDEGKSWGPGLALVWKDGRALRVNLRVEGCFGVDGTGRQIMTGSAAPATWTDLVIRLDDKEIIVLASQDSRTWQELARVPRSAFAGDPAAVRLGKMSLGLKAQDHSVPGPTGRCEIKDLRVFGASSRR